MSFDELRMCFAAFYERVKLVHEQSPRKHRGHGLDHDIVVAAIAVKIAPDERTIEKAWCAAMTHSLDRIVQDFEVEVMLRQLLFHLPKDYFTWEEIDEIVEAVLNHEKPRTDDSVTKQVLMDADRLANLMLSGALRAAQWLYERPVVEFDHLNGGLNPETTWSSPRSVLDGVKVCYQLLHPMRTIEGEAMREKLSAHLSAFVKALEGQYHDLDLSDISL